MPEKFSSLEKLTIFCAIITVQKRWKWIFVPLIFICDNDMVAGETVNKISHLLHFIFLLPFRFISLEYISDNTKHRLDSQRWVNTFYNIFGL